VKKRIIILFLIIIFFIPAGSRATDSSISSQEETLNISSFLQQGENYTKEAFPDLDINNLLTSAISGKVDNISIFRSILNLFGSEIVASITLLGSVLVVVVINSILKSISENLGNESVSQIAYYIQYILIAGLIMSNFAGIIIMIKDSINNLVGLMNSLVPILLALMMATGNIASASFLEPLILFSVMFIGNIITIVILPVTLVGATLAIVSNISDKIQIGKLANFFRSGVIWFLGLVITVFVSVASLEGTLTSSVDGITAKTTKAAVSTFIPVIGKALGDSVDTVFGASSILKNAVGVVGMIIIIGIVVMPIIKLAMLTITYHFAAAICEPMADGKIVNLLGQMGSTFKVLLAIMFFIAVLMIIGLAMTIKISNASMMYR